MSKITKQVRQDIIERDCWVCQLCKRPIDSWFEFTIDHIKPIAKGGTDEETNLQAAHKFCNELKADGEFDMDAFLSIKPELPQPISAGYSIGELIKLKSIKI